MKVETLPGPHECPACGGDLSLSFFYEEAAQCEDCYCLYPLDWDSDGDDEGEHYTWGWTGVAPPPSALWETQSYVPDARAAG